LSDIRVDKYEANISGTSGTITIDDVGSTTSAFIRITGPTRQNSAGPTGNTGTVNPNDVSVRLEITGTATVSYTRDTTAEIKVMFEVWVYVGDPGGPYEFISRQRGTVTVSGASGQAAITGMTDRNQSIPFYNGFTTTITSNADYEGVTLAVIINASNQVVFSRNNSTGSVTAQYDVVEFVGEEWSVGVARSAAHDANGTAFSGGEVVTMVTDSTGVGGSTFDVNNWEQAMIIQGTMEGDTAENGLSDTMIYIVPGSTTTQVRFTLDNTVSRNDGVAYAHVLRARQLRVTRTTAGISEGDGVPGVDLPPPFGVRGWAPLEELSLEWFPGTSGEGTAFARGSVHGILSTGGSGVPITGTGGPEEGFVPDFTYAQNDNFLNTDYDSTEDFLIGAEITFDANAAPSGAIMEGGGGGRGFFIGFNDSSGDFIARFGDGGSISPPNAARIVIPSTTFDFQGRDGRLWVRYDVSSDTAEMWWTELGNVDYDFNTTDTAATSPSDWSGGDAGGIGFAASGVAGPEVSTPATFNGTISELRFYNGPLNPGAGGVVIRNWVHRSGNSVKAAYGVADLTGLIPFVRAKRWDGAVWANVEVKAWTGLQQEVVTFWDGSEWRPQLPYN
jgi:hypothetical protein